jgi:hypothetical protein
VGVDCLPICALLTEHRVPFLLYTSYIRATRFWMARRRYQSWASQRHRRD